MREEVALLPRVADRQRAPHLPREEQAGSRAW